MVGGYKHWAIKTKKTSLVVWRTKQHNNTLAIAGLQPLPSLRPPSSRQYRMWCVLKGVCWCSGVCVCACMLNPPLTHIQTSTFPGSIRDSHGGQRVFACMLCSPIVCRCLSLSVYVCLSLSVCVCRCLFV
jgi:hypothetical protein